MKSRCVVLLLLLASSAVVWGAVAPFALALEVPSQVSSQADYQRALKIAQDKVSRDRAAESRRAGALSTSTAALLMGKPYSVGDSWEVMMWRLNQFQERNRPRSEIPASELREPVIAESGYFSFRVSAISGEPEPRIEIEITPQQQPGFALIDPAVQKIVIEADRGLRQTKKEYYLKGRTEPVAVSPNGMRTIRSVIDLLPLEFLAVDNAVRKEARYLPRLPHSILEYAKRAGFKPDLSRSLVLEQDDFFGRPIEAIWQQGDPWPVYLKTPNAIAILVRKEGA